MAKHSGRRNSSYKTGSSSSSSGGPKRSSNSSLITAVLWGVGGVLYLLASSYWDNGQLGIFSVFGYLFILMAAMYLVRWLNGRR